LVTERVIYTVTMSSKQYQIGVIEHDRNGDDLCVWAYPTITEQFISLCEKHSAQSVSNNTDNTFIYFKLKNDWVYMNRFALDASNVPDVNAATIFCIARIFNPEKYADLLKIYEKQYIENNGELPKLLQVYLDLFMNGISSSAHGSFNINNLLTTAEAAYTGIWIVYTLTS
jgi:hypothetical protein